MPSWGEVLAELQASVGPAGPDFDRVRRGHLLRLFALTGRSTVLYYGDWLSGGSPLSSITLQDKQGLMEVFRGLPGPALDLILHSPGGSPEAADALVRYMRSKFDDVRVFVPFAAMSAATMWSLAADVIVMGKHSQLGPIDPQLVMGGQYMVPAEALLRQFERAAEECKTDPARLSAWLPTLQQYTPGLLEMCDDAKQLGKGLVAEWLRAYMLKGDRGKAAKSNKIAEYFADADTHKSHGRAIDRDQARAIGVKVVDLEADPALQDAVLSVHHAVMHTLGMTGVVKIIENHLGAAFVQQQHAPVTLQIGNAPPIAP
jgi:hypothetical protein